MITSFHHDYIIPSEYSDVQQLNQLAKGEWQKMVAIVQLKSLTAPFSRLLTSESFFPSAFRVVPVRRTD